MGKTAVTLTAAINNCLLPIAAINFSIEKARDYFREFFETDLKRYAAEIPDERIVEPRATIAGPAIQGLAYSHNEPPLKDLYLRLLARSMDSDHIDDVHPAFVETIRQMSAEDALLIRHSLMPYGLQPIVEVGNRLGDSEGVYVNIRNLIDLRDSLDFTVRIVNKRVPMMIDNWQRLGLVKVDFNRRVVGQGAYDWIESRPEVIQLRAEHAQTAATRTYEIRKGVLERTEFGKAFAMATALSMH